VDDQGPAVVASPTIREVLAAFLADQRERLSPRTFRQYESVVELLICCLDGYGHDHIADVEERALFGACFQAKGEEHREFTEVFGPNKIPLVFPSFVGWFMVRKVLGGTDLKRCAGTVTRKLSTWLAEKGHISEGSATVGRQIGAGAARDLPKAERAARILDETGLRLSVDPDDLLPEDHVEFDHFRIVRLEGARVWIEASLGDEKLDAVPIPREAAALLKDNWEIACECVRVRGTWRLINVANVYPR
jgi:hypothetical protein